MSEAPFAPARRPGAPGRAPSAAQTYAALDLGTNNCRLLVATPSSEGFRIVDAYSRIVRLGEGLSLTG
ncbi:MAG: Ppx/GppA family phosphatase, partial [Methyloceanibacter sp.]